MIRGLYISGTGMLTAQKQMDIITNNIANVETAGFKSDDMLSRSFASMLIERIHDPAVVSTREVGPLEPGVHIDEIITDFTQGPLDQTNINTDLALAGAGYFVINTPEGERYTRAGNFTVNANGYLVTQEGYGVMGSGGPIFVGNDQFAVNQLGEITKDGEIIDQLRLVTFNDETLLRKAGDNLFLNYGGAQSVDLACTVHQGILESSNVNVGEVMVDMITVYRLYEANQKMLQTADETLGRAVNEIAKV